LTMQKSASTLTSNNIVDQLVLIYLREKLKQVIIRSKPVISP